MKFETIEELVEQRRGYKYLNKDRISPYQNYKYDLRRRLVVDRLDEDINRDCGAGWNLATLDWILRDTNVLNKIIVEFEIPPEGKIIVPIGSRGKFRTDIIKKKRIWNPEELFPQLKDISKRLANYKFINPITAEVLPPKEKILNIMAQVRDQVGAQVGDQVWAQVGAIAYFAIKLFLDLPYEHPVFDLIRLGVIVVNVNGKYKIFGKNGKYLGEI